MKIQVKELLEKIGSNPWPLDSKTLALMDHCAFNFLDVLNALERALESIKFLDEDYDQRDSWKDGMRTLDEVSTIEI